MANIQKTIIQRKIVNNLETINVGSGYDFRINSCDYGCIISIRYSGWY